MARYIELDEVRAKIEKRYEYWKEKESNSHSIESEIRMSECQHLLLMLDSLQEEPVSEPNKELAKTYLDVFDKKFPILPTLKGKELADYKNFLNKCQQIFGLKHWGIYPTQAKLFEKISLLWVAWGVEHLHELGKYNKEEQDTTVSEDLEKAAVEAFKQIVDTDKNNFLEIFKAGAKWKEGHMMKDAIDAELDDMCGFLTISVPYHNGIAGDKVKVVIIKSE